MIKAWCVLGVVSGVAFADPPKPDTKPDPKQAAARQQAVDEAR